MKFIIDDGEIRMEIADHDPLPRIEALATCFMAHRGRRPAYLLIGWLTYAQLGASLARANRVDRLMDPTSLYTPAGEVQIIVDDTSPDRLELLPRLGEHRRLGFRPQAQIIIDDPDRGIR